jgi:type I protein arginine methyltransferase
MAPDKMEVEVAEKKLNNMEHSEQHYFKRYVGILKPPT